MTKKCIIGIDRQHSGQVGRYITSVGASKDIDGDGKKELHESEAMWTARYGLWIEIGLREAGYHPIPISDGSYAERHERMNNYAKKMKCPAIYLALHCNAGGGDYSLMFYDYRSKNGKSLAQKIADNLQESMPEIRDHKIRAARPDDWTRNALYTIKNLGAPIAICCEPLFLDHPNHKLICNPAGMEKLGRAIAKGIIEWIQINL